MTFAMYKALHSRYRRLVDTNYTQLHQQLKSLLDGESDALANSANFVALLFAGMTDINWVGIYVLRDDELVLGPFQGLPACVRIPMGHGVCGTSASKGQTLRIPDVYKFAGHIACDPASRSELVVPLRIANSLVGVLDIDSPTPGRFSAADQAGIERLCDEFVARIQLNKQFI